MLSSLAFRKFHIDLPLKEAMYQILELDSNGVITSASSITFPSGWDTRPADRNRWSMAHELGHLSGLDDNACSELDGIMGPATACTDTSGMSLVVTVNDALTDF